jgi:NADH dehydrogenase (ubiquinone) 1 alpha subcomplex subunit 5
MFLRAVARPLMAKIKQTTGIVGLDVVPNAREVLIGLYSKTLNEIQKVPKDEGYRKAVESFTSHRLKVCQEEEDWEKIENRLGCGQVEELIEEAQDELKLIGYMIGIFFFYFAFMNFYFFYDLLCFLDCFCDFIKIRN